MWGCIFARVLIMPEAICGWGTHATEWWDLTLNSQELDFTYCPWILQDKICFSPVLSRTSGLCLMNITNPSCSARIKQLKIHALAAWFYSFSCQLDSKLLEGKISSWEIILEISESNPPILQVWKLRPKERNYHTQGRVMCDLEPNFTLFPMVHCNALCIACSQ